MSMNIKSELFDAVRDGKTTIGQLRDVSKNALFQKDQSCAACQSSTSEFHILYGYRQGQVVCHDCTRMLVDDSGMGF